MSLGKQTLQKEKTTHLGFLDHRVQCPDSTSIARGHAVDLVHDQTSSVRDSHSERVGVLSSIRVRLQSSERRKTNALTEAPFTYPSRELLLTFMPF